MKTQALLIRFLNNLDYPTFLEYLVSWLGSVIYRKVGARRRGSKIRDSGQVRF